jgi:elongation factor Ts
MSFVKMATEMANQALNFDTKEAFFAADFNGITIADKLIEQKQVSEKITIRTLKIRRCFQGLISTLETRLLL